MGSIERRLEKLEARCGVDEDRQARDRRTEEKRAEIIARMERVIAQEGENPNEPSRRRRALEYLQEFVERRKRGA